MTQALLIAILCLALLTLNAVIRHARRWPHYTAMLFLSVQSHEELRQSPAKTLLLRRNVHLPSAPPPGAALDGLGLAALKIDRTVLNVDTPFEFSVYLSVRVELDQVETLAKELATDHQWRILW